MKIYGVMTCFTNTSVILEGVFNLFDTVGVEFEKFIFVENKYPLESFKVNAMVNALAYIKKGVVTSPIKNLGGHGGFNFAFDQLKANLNDDDLILGVDPDCNIKTKGWGKKMAEVMAKDPTIGSLSLLHEHIAPHNMSLWERKEISGTIVGFLNKPEMFNVTAWNAGFLKKTKGLIAGIAYYGHVETSMRNAALEHGYRQGYLLEYIEGLNKVPHDEAYNNWKRAHAIEGYAGNFDEFLKEKK